MRHWIQTRSGLAFDLADPQPDMVCLQDIASALARMPRFTGHGSAHYTVAQHSVLAAVCCADRDQRAACLLHDASEAYTCDLSAPLKRLLREHTDAFDIIEARIQNAINARFGLPHDAHKHPAVKAVDLALVHTERRCFMGTPPADWSEPEPADVYRSLCSCADIQAWSGDHAREEFLVMARLLAIR